MASPELDRVSGQGGGRWGWSPWLRNSRMAQKKLVCRWVPRLSLVSHYSARKCNSELRCRDTGHLLLICPLSGARALTHCSKAVFKALCQCCYPPAGQVQPPAALSRLTPACAVASQHLHSAAALLDRPGTVRSHALTPCLRRPALNSPRLHL